MHIVRRKIIKILSESLVSWPRLQVLLVSDLLEHPKIILLGKSISEWDSLDNKEKIDEILLYFNNVGILIKLREWLEKENIKYVTPLVIDFEDVSEPYTGNLSKHIEQLENSTIFNDLKEFILNSL